jgi:hypothetical protein
MTKKYLDRQKIGWGQAKPGLKLKPPGARQRQGLRRDFASRLRSLSRRGRKQLLTHKGNLVPEKGIEPPTY